MPLAEITRSRARRRIGKNHISHSQEISNMSAVFGGIHPKSGKTPISSTGIPPKQVYENATIRPMRIVCDATASQNRLLEGNKFPDGPSPGNNPALGPSLHLPFVSLT